MTVFFGGSLGDWYGPMLEKLVVYCREHVPCVRFKIYGALETWGIEFDQWVRAEGIFGGRVEFRDLLKRAAEADLLILPMGFGEECALVERTSFKTKFLDYLSFQRPILVWGPEYCSAVRVAREFESGECVTDESAEVCGQAIARLANDPERRSELIMNASKMYLDRFHPDRIHNGLVEKIRELIKNQT
jgi:glycosyltransferase involved in cell wall biosynthesis